MRLRNLRRWLNIRLMRWGFPPLLLLAACSQCNLPPPTPEEPTSTDSTSTESTITSSSTAGETLEQRCSNVCQEYRRRGCVEGNSVCAADGWNEDGECVRTVRCEDECQRAPDFYLTWECE